MKSKIKLALLSLSTGIALHLGCIGLGGFGGGSGGFLRFLGDLAGDALWLRGID